MPQYPRDVQLQLLLGATLSTRELFCKGRF
jgi:hypothetical protein